MLAILLVISFIVSPVPTYAADIPNYQFVEAFPETRNYKQVLQALDFAFDRAGNAYVVDNKLNVVIKYNAVKDYVLHWDVGYARSLAVDLFTDQVYIGLTTGELQIFDDGGNLLHTFGGSGTGDGQFNWISHITIDDSYIYISDEMNHHVQIFNKSDRSFVAKLGTAGTGDGEFQQPSGLFVDEHRHLYVADTFNSRIQLFHYDHASHSWTYHSQFGTGGSNPDEFNYPNDLIVRSGPGSSSVLLVVFDTGLNRLSQIPITGYDLSTIDASEIVIESFDNTIFDRHLRANMVWNPLEEELYATNQGIIAKLSDVTDTSSWIGWSDDQFSHSEGVAVDRLGNIYIADSTTHRILKYNASGDFVLSWGSFGSAEGEFNRPRGIAIDSNNDIYVADTSNNRIQKFDANGTFIREWGSLGNTDGQFLNMSAIAIDINDHVYVGGTRVVQKFNVDGHHLLTIGHRQCNFPSEPSCSDAGNLDSPRGIGFDSVGNIYVADQNTHLISKFQSDGTFLSRWGGNGSDPGQFNRPAWIAIDDVDRIYVVDTSNARIQVFKADGSYLFEYGRYHNLNTLSAIAMDQHGTLYVLDHGTAQLKVFKEQPAGPITDVAANGEYLAVKLSFTAPIGATSVVVKQREYGTSTWTDATVQRTIFQDSTEATVIGLMEDTEYELYLEVIGGPYAGSSNIVRAKTYESFTAINDLVAVGGDGEVVLTFSPLTAATSVDVKVWLPGAGDWTDATTSSPITAGATTATVIGLDDDTFYSFYIYVTGGPRTGASNRADATTNPAPIPPSTPLADLAATGGNKEVFLTFSPPTGATSVTIKQRISGTSTWSDAITSTAITESSTNATVIDLADDTTYEFYLEVINGAHAGDSNTAIVTTKRPSPPSGGHSSGTSGSSIDLSEVNLKSLTVNVGSIMPAFSPTIQDYTLLLEYEVEEIEITAIPKDDAATVKLKTQDIDNPVSIQLPVGNTELEITVRARDGSEKTYTLIVVRQPELIAPQASFTDISGHWAEGSIKQAVERDIVTGYSDDTFRPDHSTTRAEFVVFLAKTLDWMPLDETHLSFEDGREIPNWALGYMNKAVHEEAVLGYSDGTLRANQAITRAEAVTILMRALGMLPEVNKDRLFADDHHIPPWAREYVYAAVTEGIIMGRGRNSFEPNEPLTRAEAVTIFMRAMAVRPE